MPLKVTTSTKTGETRFCWTSQDESAEAAWRLKSDADEGDILDILERVARFVRAQRHEKASAEYALEKAIYDVDEQDDLPVPVPSRSTNDLPAGGPATIGWAALVNAPQIPAESAAAGWEYIPPGEM